LDKALTVNSIRQLAEQLGVSHTILNRHKRNGKFTEEPGGGYDVERARESLAATMARPVKLTVEAPRKPAVSEDEDRPGGSPREGTLSYEQWRLTREKADAAELQKRRLASELVSMVEAEAVRVEMAVKFREAVKAFPARVVVRLPAEWKREAYTVMEDEAQRLLLALSNDFREDAAAA